METLGQRIRYAREAKHLTQKDVAAHFNIKRESVAGWEADDSRPDSSRLSGLVALLGCSFDWLLTGAGEPPTQQPKPVRGEKLKIVPYEGPALDRRSQQLIPVYAAAMGGQGHLIVDFNPIEHLPPPEDLIRVQGAYGILIVGESMVPAFRPGDIAWVNPNRPPERDAEAVFYHVPPHDEAEAMIKTLVTFTPKDWKLRQYQPPKEWQAARADWPVCHRIVGKKAVR